MNDNLNENLSEKGFTAEEIEIITLWWNPREHGEWLMNATATEIREATAPAFEN